MNRLLVVAIAAGLAGWVVGALLRPYRNEIVGCVLGLCEFACNPLGGTRCGGR